MENIQAQFTLFDEYQKSEHRALHYFDSAATTLTPKTVVASMNAYYDSYRANIDRSVFGLSLKADAEFNKAKSKIANFIGATPEEIIITQGATEASNILLDMLVEQDSKCRIVCSHIEHHAVLVPLLSKKEKNIDILFFEDQIFSVENYGKYIHNNKPDIVYMQLASNVTGEIFDVRAICDAAHSVGARVICDVSQAVGHTEVDVNKLGIDAAFFSAHKMFGPTGIGVLYVTSDWLETFKPVIFGGSAVSSVSLTKYTLRESTQRFEPGTQNIAGVIGFGAAVDFIATLDINKVEVHLQQIFEYTLGKLAEVPGIKVYTAKKNTGIVAFAADRVHPHDIEYILAEKGIALRSGFFCAEPYVRALADGPMTRISLHIYTTRADVDFLVEELKKVIMMFKK